MSIDEDKDKNICGCNMQLCSYKEEVVRSNFSLNVLVEDVLICHVPYLGF